MACRVSQTVDLLFLPGDRFEIFSVACAKYYSLVPIATSLAVIKVRAAI